MKDHRTSLRRPVARKEAFFGLNFTLTAENPTENISLLLSQVRPDYVQLWLKTHLGYLYYRGAQGTTAPDMQGDPLSIWRDKTREHGVELVAHYTGLWSEADIREHPQWASIKADGTQDTMYASTFGRYVDERLIPQLHEVLTRYGLEGVWMDGDCWAAQLDYSEASLAAWRKETGYGDAPRQRSDPHWHQWKAFQRRQFERYMKLWVDDIHERCPGVGVCDNWAYGPSMPLPLSVAIDWLSGDHSPTDAVDNERMVGRLWSNMGLPWELHAWAFNHGSRTRIPVGTTYKMAEHLKQEAAVPLMLGGGITLGSYCAGTGYVPEAVIEVYADVAEFCRARQQFCHRSHSVPQVALVHSSAAYFDNCDAVIGSAWGPYEELNGALHALLEEHYCVDILTEELLRDRLGEFPLVVLPDPHLLADGFVDALIGYVERGGRLLLLGQRCARLFNEEILGVRFEGSHREVDAVLRSSCGLDPRVLGQWQSVIPVSAHVIGYRHPTATAGVDGATMAGSPVYSEQEPAVTITDHGAGQIATVFGPVALGYQRTHHPALRQFIAEIVRRLFPEPAVRVDAPPCVDLSLRRSPAGKLSLHLLNLSNAQRGKDFLNTEFVPPLGPIRVWLSVPEKPKAVTWEPGHEPLDWSFQEGVLSTEVPSLHIHGAILLE